MKEALLALILSNTSGIDHPQNYTLMQVVKPASNGITTVTYIPAITATDTRADNGPAITRHVTVN